MASYYVLLSILLLPLFLFMKLKSTALKRRYKLPPGPWTLPGIGSLHHLVGAGHPHHAIRDMSKRYGDLMFLQLGEIPTVVVSSKEAATEILKNHDLAFCNRPAVATVKTLYYGGNDMGFSPYGEHWRDLRKIASSELLSAKRVRSFQSIREKEVANLIQWISSSSSSSSSSTVNLSEGLMVTTNNTLLQAFMGSKIKNQKNTLTNILRAFDVITGFNLANLFPSSSIAGLISGAMRQAEECHRSFDRLIDSIISDYKEADGEVEDLLRVLLRLQDEATEKKSTLTPDVIKSVVLDLITAGTDTTALTLEWVMAELMRNPKAMKKVQAEIRQQLQGLKCITELDITKLNYLHLVIKETLRLHPAPFIPRECREDCKIFGYDIPKGTNVLISLWAMGRDPRIWEDPEEFKPERFEENDVPMNGHNFELIPFGAGRRSCPGMSFALAALEIALANVLYHFDWELAGGVKPEELDMSETFGFVTRKKLPLLLHARPYHALN